MVLQAAGRSGGYNPHLHIIMTAGGVDEEIEEVVAPRGYPMWKRYPKGLVAHIKHVLSEAEGKGQVPEKSEGLARYLAKYIVSPPISIRRIISYDGEQVRYWYKGLS